MDAMSVLWHQRSTECPARHADTAPGAGAPRAADTARVTGARPPAAQGAAARGPYAACYQRGGPSAGCGGSVRSGGWTR